MPRSKTPVISSKRTSKTPKLRRHASGKGYVVFSGGKPIYLGKYDSDRLILLGPHVQELIRPFLADRPVDAYLFSPAEAEAERRAEMPLNRKTPLSCGNKPGTNKSKNPKRSPGDQYRVDTLLKAIQEGSEKAFPPPAKLQRRRVPGRRKNTTRWETPQEHKERLGEEGWAALLAWHAEHRFTSRQITVTKLLA